MLDQSDVHFELEGLVASASPTGDSASFYSELFDAECAPELSRRTRWNNLKQPGTREPDKSFCSVLDRIEASVGRQAVVLEIGGGIYQTRCCNAYERFENYIPLDLSASSIRRYAQRYGRHGIIADATRLPIRSGSVDAVFTRTFLEHVPRPELALSEIRRVLRPGGIVVHQDAWFCRWWHRFGVVGLVPWSAMTLRERAIYLASRCTEFPPARAAVILGRRLLREAFCASSNSLAYRKLRPNYRLHLGCDEDAASSIDPAEVLRHYCANGCDVGGYASSMHRVLFRGRRIEARMKVGVAQA